MDIRLTLSILQTVFAVCRLDPGADIPAWAQGGELTAVTRTRDELSIVCAELHVPDGIAAERGWRCIKVAGPLDFALTGILAALAVPLARAGMSIFAISTYDTDYLLVRSDHVAHAISVLRAEGHHIIG